MGETRKFTKFTPSAQRAYLGSIEGGVAKRRAAAAAGISYQLVWEYKKENPDFALKEIAAAECAVGAIEDALHANARGGNTTAQIFYLKNKAPEDWTDVYDDVLRGRLIAEAKEQFAEVLTEAFAAEGIEADVIERIATKMRTAKAS